MVYVVAALAAIPVFILTLLYHEDQSKPLDVIGFFVFKESFVTFFSNRRLRATALIDMATYFAFGAFETFLPLLLASRSVGAGETGIIFAVQVLIIAGTKPLFGKLADRIDKRIQIAAGILILGCSVAVIPLMHTFGEFLAVSSILGFGMSLSTIATSAYVAEVSKKEHVGASMGALSATMDIGHAGGPLITGIIITVMGYAAGFLASFIFAILVAVIFAVSVRGTVK
jgi:MFS family permease